MRALIFFVCTISLSGCLLGNEVRMSKEHAQFIKKVGVISLLDKHANIHYAAQEPKDIIDRRGIIKDWQINQQVAEHIVGRLKQKGFNARTLPTEQSLLSVYDSSWATPNTASVHSQLYEIGARAGVDMLVVIYRQRVSEFISKGRENVRGYGIFKTHRIEPHLYAAVYVEALDVNKKYILGQSNGQKAEKPLNSLWNLGFEQGKSPVVLPFSANGEAGKELSELVKLAALLAAQEAGLSN
jgi:hypothetical protein